MVLIQPKVKGDFDLSYIGYTGEYGEEMKRYFPRKPLCMQKIIVRVSHRSKNKELYLVQKENEIPSEVYNVTDSEEGLRDLLVFNDPYWLVQQERSQ
ncbi:hypothetical protein Y1Q_0006587 [Alligator mississippiensis]|uniref:Uncharacterized protein n=1 Tax=Alligator mississippiensis TaxID=8496 RepID=A0A151NTG7_ALLMI|nr:hypothetical protein Y1Q_0006587 [Alligator mississippiensis]